VDSVARALRVGHVLEGSVRKAGDQVRITAQLIDAASGFHVWSETYERSLDDVFAVQDEISRAVAAQLRIELAGDAPLAQEATADPEAHTLVLRGRAIYQRGTREAMAEAARLYREATLRDPGYAQAHARLAGVLMVQANYRYVPRDEGFAEARALAERALGIEPCLSEAHTVLGRIADTYEWRFAAAEKHLMRAVDCNPGDARARSLYAWILMRLGRPEESLREARRAVELDPLSMPAFNNLGAMYAYAGLLQRALEASEIALSLAPGAASVAANLAVTYLDVGREADALRLADSARALEPEDHYPLAVLGYVRARMGRRIEAEEALAELRGKPEVSPYLIATVYAGLGDRDSVFQWLERAVEVRDDAAPDLGVDPTFAEYRGDPRMRRLLGRIGLE
jgi:Flp pilus assembly protein TadD